MAEDLPNVVVGTDVVIHLKVVTIAAGAMITGNNILQTSVQRGRGDVHAPLVFARDECVLRETMSESCQQPSNPSFMCISVVHLELRPSDVNLSLKQKARLLCRASANPNSHGHRPIPRLSLTTAPASTGLTFEIATCPGVSIHSGPES